MEIELFDQDNLYEMKKSVLLRVAADCFNNLGYSGTSLKYLAKRLNLTDAALYYYVKSKEELVFLCYDRAMTLGEASLEKAIADSDNGLHALRLFIENGIEAMVGESGPVAVVSELSSLGPKYKDKLMARAIRHTRRVAGVIEEGIKDGSIAPCNARVACDVILGALSWIPKWHRPEKPMAIADIKQAFTQTLLHGLQPRSS